MQPQHPHRHGHRRRKDQPGQTKLHGKHQRDDQQQQRTGPQAREVARLDAKLKHQADHQRIDCTQHSRLWVGHQPEHQHQKRGQHDTEPRHKLHDAAQHGQQRGVRHPQHEISDPQNRSRQNDLGEGVAQQRANPFLQIPPDTPHPATCRQRHRGQPQSLKTHVVHAPVEAEDQDRNPFAQQRTHTAGQ